jgi:hypothetical protein
MTHLFPNLYACENGGICHCSHLKFTSSLVSERSEASKLQINFFVRSAINSDGSFTPNIMRATFKSDPGINFLVQLATSVQLVLIYSFHEKSHINAAAVELAAVHEIYCAFLFQLPQPATRAACTTRDSSLAADSIADPAGCPSRDWIDM